MSTIMETLQTAESYYDRFSYVYDLFAPRWYYHSPRQFAIQMLALEPGQNILNVPCGTGQNFAYFQQYLVGSGSIVGVDLSAGMLRRAHQKVTASDWTNIELIKAEAAAINVNWIKTHFGEALKFDGVLCDLGLSGFPEWQAVIDNLLSVLRPGGRIVVMDWYIEKPSLWGEFIKWIGNGEVNRPIHQYLSTRVDGFQINDSFKGGDVFVAWGYKRA